MVCLSANQNLRKSLRTARRLPSNAFRASSRWRRGSSGTSYISALAAHFCATQWPGCGRVTRWPWGGRIIAAKGTAPSTVSATHTVQGTDYAPLALSGLWVGMVGKLSRRLASVLSGDDGASKFPRIRPMKSRIGASNLAGNGGPPLYFQCM